MVAANRVFCPNTVLVDSDHKKISTYQVISICYKIRILKNDFIINL